MMSPSTSAKANQALRLRATGKTLQEIGAILKITRERSRQLLLLAKKEWPKEHSLAIAAHCDVTAPEPKPYWIPNFRSVVYRWLRDAGFIACVLCKDVQNEDQYGESVRSGNCQTRICRTCNARRARERYQGNPAHRAKCLQYQRDNPERSRAASLRYAAKKRAERAAQA